MSPLGCAALHAHRLMCFARLLPLQEDGGSRAPPLRLLSEREAVGFLWSDDDSLARRWGNNAVIGWREVATRPTCCYDFLLPAKAVGHPPDHQLSCPSHSRSPTPTPLQGGGQPGHLHRAPGGGQPGSGAQAAQRGWVLTLALCFSRGHAVLLRHRVGMRPSVHRSRCPPTPPHHPMRSAALLAGGHSRCGDV